ncbi:predicted protein [Lichtheimia corymbifera JMRC:FSU:9682]|uniref:BLOC-1-related complex subunit 5 n=1 Tax=Lichtheimia corymbifera JMRC:FSU:9682 TaxID=1263082 RepID=A0A068RFK3_9FUNG|nr:predicted protein [Lichtheimia corymbifera JMRC:FSU:9682]
MGQDQSTQKHDRLHDITEADMALSSEASSVIEGSQARNAVAGDDGGSDKGIIQVVHGAGDDGQEEEILRLQQVKRFTPLVRENDRGFGLDGLLGIAVGNRSSSNASQEQTNRMEIDPEPLADTLFRLYQHTEAYKSKMCERQKCLHDRIQYAERLSQQTTQALILALNQAKNANERIPEIKALTTHAEKAQGSAKKIMEGLNNINSYLASDDQLDNAALETRWPVLSPLLNTTVDTNNIESTMDVSS